MVNVLICENIDDIDQRENFDKIFLWSSFRGDSHAISLPEVVDDNFEILRKRYLKWLAELGQSQFNGKSLVELFSLRPDFSAWWMSLIVEKSQWKSNAAYQAFRLMAFDDELNHLPKDSQNLVTINVVEKPVRVAFIKWCKNRNIPFFVKHHQKTANRVSLRQLYDKLPYVIQTIIYFLYYAFTRQRLNWRNTDRKLLEYGQQVSFFSYFFNLDKKALKDGHFRSGYWGKLYDYLSTTRLKQNWFHLYVNNPEKTTPRYADKLLETLNDENVFKHQKHQLIDHNLGVGSWFTIIRDYCKLWIAARKLGEAKKHFLLSDDGVDLWPLMAPDWKDSFSGKTAAMNVIYLHLFERKLKALPHQAQGFYLMENQGWERALAYAWKQAGHGKLIAVQHATMIPCDLRHAFAAEEYNSKASFGLPLPDIVALNSRNSCRQYQALGFPMDKVMEVEALRYLYLGRLSKVKAKKPTNLETLRLLVLGDYLPEVTNKQMQLVAKAARCFPENTKIYVKSHPAYPIIYQDWPDLQFTLMTSSLDQLIDSYDIAFVSNMTGAALDAFFAGKRVLSMLDAQTFNMSPLRGFNGVDFITTSKELIDTICQINDNAKFNANANANVDDKSLLLQDMEEDFFTDAELPGWRRLLKKELKKQ